MKRVCVVGAGPAGLVAAKTLLQQGSFSVTVYEKGQGSGGLWAVDENSQHASQHNFIGAHTPTNLSKYTVSFSDLSWDSVDLGVKGEDGGTHEKRQTPMFPKAWMVGKYLEMYRRKFLPENIIRFQRDVREAKRYNDGEGSPKWHVTTSDGLGHQQTEIFDYLVTASGFFSKPRAPLLDNKEDRPDWATPTIHSSHYRHLSDFQPKTSPCTLSNIVVIGGGNSAGEAAATVASQISSKRWSPGVANPDHYADCKIYHVMDHPMYALTPYSAADETATTYMPLDLKLYDLSRRPAGPIVANAGRIPDLVKNNLHGAIQGILGSNQSDLGSNVLVSEAGPGRKAPFVALSESYSEYVRDGLIVPVAGRATTLENTGYRSSKITVTDGGRSKTIEDVNAVVECTGYKPATALSYLPEDVKSALHFDVSSNRLPLMIEKWQTMSSQVPDLSFIGFYEGPYWGIMEQQARLTADRWSNLTSEHQPERPFESQESLHSLRLAMVSGGQDIPQYWFGDYLGYMEEIARSLKLRRNDGAFDVRTGCVVAARYLAPGDHVSEADKTMQDLHETWQACQRGRYVPRAVIRALHGRWKLNRTINSANASYPTGRFVGEASFHPRSPTAKGFGLEYLYIESGEFTPENSSFPPMTASRRYVYRYSEETDQLSVWFVKPDKDLEVDYLFHNLVFGPPEEARTTACVIARADHLCGKDIYWTEYRLPMQGIALKPFEIKHTVKGPSGGKDYVMRSKYQRPSV